MLNRVQFTAAQLVGLKAITIHLELRQIPDSSAVWVDSNELHIGLTLPHVSLPLSSVWYKFESQGKSTL
jgi:hypothetical protein